MKKRQTDPSWTHFPTLNHYHRIMSAHRYPDFAYLITPKDVRAQDEHAVRLAKWERIESLLKGSEAWAPRTRANLNSKLHDSRLTEIVFRDGCLTLFLNDFSTHCLSDALVEREGLKVPHRARCFPIEIRFIDLRSLTVFRIDRNHKLIKMSPTKILHLLDEFLFDEVIEFSPNGIDVGMLLGTSRLSARAEKDPYFLVRIESRQIAIMERQREAFESLFGGKYLDVFERFWAERSDGVVFDCSDAGKFLM